MSVGNWQFGAKGDESVIQNVQSIGQTLRKARETLNLSRDDVATALKLQTKFIVALESDQFDLLPEHTFVKGYIRSYSSLLKLDPDHLLEQLQYEPETNPGIVPITNINVPVKRPAQPRRARKKFRWLLWMLFSIIVIGAAILYTAFRFLDQPGTFAPSVLESDEGGQQLPIPYGEEPLDGSPEASRPAKIEGLAIPVE